MSRFRDLKLSSFHVKVIISTRGFKSVTEKLIGIKKNSIDVLQIHLTSFCLFIFKTGIMTISKYIESVGYLHIPYLTLHHITFTLPIKPVVAVQSSFLNFLLSMYTIYVHMRRFVS